MNGINQIDFGALAIRVGLQQTPRTLLTSNERTWYGFFMECFECLSNCFCSSNLPEETSFTDVVLVAKGYYSLTEERLVEWNNRFSPILPNIERVLPESGCFVRTSDQLTAMTIINFIAESHLINNEGDLSIGPRQQLVDTRIDEYVLRFSDLSEEYSTLLQQHFTQMNEALSSPDLSIDELVNTVVKGYSLYQSLSSRHICKVLETKAAPYLLLESNYFIDKLFEEFSRFFYSGDNQEKNLMKRYLTDYQMNQTIVQNVTREAVALGARADESTIRQMREAVKQLLNEEVECKKHSQFDLAEQKRTEAESLFNTMKQMNPSISEKEREDANKALSKIGFIIRNHVEECLPFRQFSFFRKSGEYQFNLADGFISIKQENASFGFRFRKEDFLNQLKDGINTLQALCSRNLV